MENAALLSPADINVIRRYVQTKYAPLPKEKRAEIVADAIRQTLQRRLPDLQADLKERMADELIRRCLLTERREIKPDDVLDVCAGIELPDSSSEAVILDPVLRWMNERAPGKWSHESLISRLFRRLPDHCAVEEAAAVVEAHNIPLETVSGSGFAIPWSRLLRRIPKTAWAMAVLVLAGGVVSGVYLGQPAPLETPVPAIPRVPLMESAAPAADIGMPQVLKFREIDAAAVKTYLKSRDSALADEPYFSAIVDSAKLHDINPLLMFAVTGQEQGFVPKSNKNAKEIANNPFNVHHSWEDYNTEISNSADIAARTLSRRGSIRPEGHEPFSWLNLTYAEDPNWGEGVKQIFMKLEGLSSKAATKQSPTTR